MKTIPYSRQFISAGDIKLVVRAMKSDLITQGPMVQKFEGALCKYTGAKYCVAVSSGTAALHLSMLALGVSKKNKVITSPITFSASANCALYVGARPEFIDINKQTYHLDIEKLHSFLKVPSQRKRIKVVIPVHFMGTVIDIIAIKRICDKYGIKIVEDAAHALGAKYKFNGDWVKVGACRHSDITIFSFHPIKHITTGEGGAALTNSRKIYEKLLSLRHHGIIKNKNKPLWFYDIPQYGFNYRITDFQCALGVSQLKRLDRSVEARRKLADNYNRAFCGLKEIYLSYSRPDTYPSYHLYVIRAAIQERNKLYVFLRKNNILTQVNYIPVHLFSYYQKKFGYKRGDFPIAEKYYRECLSLPLYFGLTQEQQSRVVRKIKDFFSYG